MRELFPTKDYDARIEARRPPPAPAEETGCGVCQQQCPEQQQQQQQGAKRKTPVGDHEAEQEDGGRKSPSPPAPAAERAPQPDQATRTPVNDLAEGVAMALEFAQCWRASRCCGQIRQACLPDRL